LLTASSALITDLLQLRVEVTADSLVSGQKLI
jgi:hypothetical protein